jgi:hypothetical protein
MNYTLHIDEFFFREYLAPEAMKEDKHICINPAQHRDFVALIEQISDKPIRLNPNIEYKGTGTVKITVDEAIPVGEYRLFSEVELNDFKSGWNPQKWDYRLLHGRFNCNGDYIWPNSEVTRKEYPLINILIRTSNRPSEFKRMLGSIVRQRYPNIRIIVGYDNPTALNYIPEGLETVYVTADRSQPFFYDQYCNQLKELVTDGYFIFLDDDDTLIVDVLSKINLTGPGLIVQLQRVNNIVPQSLTFQRGRIGMPCLILHHSLKNIADVPFGGAGDYFWIKAVTDQVAIPFEPIVVVYSFGRGLGKCQ